MTDRRFHHLYHTMSDKIRHEGKVESIDGEHIAVRIIQRSACTSCKLAKSCLTSESKVKVVDVWTQETGRFYVGQDVMVEVTGKIGALAVVLGFVMPTILVIATVILTLFITAHVPALYVEEPANEAVAALLGLGVLVPYYIILYIMRGNIRRKVTFSIMPLC